MLNSGAEAVLDSHVQQLASARESLLSGFQLATNDFAERLEAASVASDRRITHLQGALQESTLAAAEQMEALHQQGQLLMQIFAKEDQLVRLQERLDKNLETVRVAETFDETLHNLAGGCPHADGKKPQGGVVDFAKLTERSSAVGRRTVSSANRG